MKTATLNAYFVQFDFTTVHGKGRFVGRSGQFTFETADELDEVNKNIADVQNLCAQFIHNEKPKWNILLVNVKSITQTYNQ